MENVEITRRELTLADVLSDPMVRAMMEADHVDQEALARSLTAIAQSLNSRPSRDRRLRSFWPSTVPPRCWSTDSGHK
jgi:hypothetical protein